MYSAIICSGHIQNPQSCTSHISVTSACDAQKSIEINTNENFFKCILELEIGTNVLIFQYCSSSINVTIDYKPRETSFTVVPLYIICEGHDGRFQAPSTEPNLPKNACKRITTACKLLQSVFGHKFGKVGLEKRSFVLDSECLIWYSKLNVEKALNMTQTELWYHFAREIMSSNIASSNKKYLAFLSCTVYHGDEYYDGISYKDMLNLMRGYVAYGGDGLALLSTGCLYTWPETLNDMYSRFGNCTLVNKAKFMDDSNSRGTWGGCFITSLGAVLHELCHTFDLGHSDAGIMGPNFGHLDDIFMASGEEQEFSDYRCTDVSKVTTDYTGWSKSSMFIIYYHKWFHNVVGRKSSLISYDNSTNVIKSIAGIRVIEIRRKDDEMVLKGWVFGGKVLKFSFHIADNLTDFDGNIILFAEDGCGNILKQQLK
ncbi:hypothetical protein RI129_006582 [Pyrocoelia pectoralis]|uniref:Zinc metalloproteinase n=1 Tax=Pyrocoelia pectoralis TaxID=417401 RepID=A0AAN7VCP9_9COLE